MQVNILNISKALVVVQFPQKKFRKNPLIFGVLQQTPPLTTRYSPLFHKEEITRRFFSCSSTRKRCILIHEVYRRMIRARYVGSDCVATCGLNCRNRYSPLRKNCSKISFLRSTSGQGARKQRRVLARTSVCGGLSNCTRTASLPRYVIGNW